MNPYTREATGAMVAGILLVLLAFALAVVVAASKADGAEPRTLLGAIRQVESSGRANPPPGDGGRSQGPLQCGRAAWQDGCEYGGVDWPYELVHSLPHVSKVFVWYTSRYGAKTDEERARCWNSGPRWRAKYGKTERYWNKVKAAAKGG